MMQLRLFALVASLIAGLVVGITRSDAWLVQAPSGGGGGSTTAWTTSAGANNASTTVSTTTTTNDTVTANNAGQNVGNRANNAGYSGKVFVLYKILSASGAFTRIGYCNSSTVLNSAGNFCGYTDANGISVELTNGVLRNNNGTNAHQFNAGVSIVAGNWVEIAYDMGNNLVWARVSTNAGSSWGGSSGCSGGPCWNDTNSGQDPNTATGGFSVTATGPYFLYFADNSSTTNQVQFDCNSSSYNSDLPTGFSRC